MIYEKVIWTHPVKRRFKTRLSMAGLPLKQELSGIQAQETQIVGANHEEYAAAVQESAVTDYVEGLDASASPIFRHGYESFRVSITGSKRVPAGTVDPGSYVYSPESAKL